MTKKTSAPKSPARSSARRAGAAGPKTGSKTAGKAAGRSNAERPSARKDPAKSGARKALKTAQRRAPEPDRSSVDEVRRNEALSAAEAAIDAALDKKAFVPVLLDVSGRASYTDFIGIVSGRSDRQVEAIAEGVRECMKDRGFHLLGREGSGNGRWTLLDFGDVVVHVFYHPVREVYDIEGLWMDAPRVQLSVPPEAMHAQHDTMYG